MNLWQRWLRSKWRRRLDALLLMLLIPVWIWIALRWGWRDVAIPLLIGLPVLLLLIVGLGAYDRLVSRRFGAAAAPDMSSSETEGQDRQTPRRRR